MPLPIRHSRRIVSYKLDGYGCNFNLHFILANYYPQASTFAQPRPPSKGNMRPTSAETSNQYDSLFSRPSGVTFFGGQVGTSIPFNHTLYTTPGGSLNENINLPPMTDGLGMLAHQSHSPNTGQYGMSASPGYY